jgi:transposase
MVKNHLYGIINAVVMGVTNARAEGINAVIQQLKAQARGFRNRERFSNSIYFHCGKLDFYPDSLTTREKHFLQPNGINCAYSFS